MREIREQASSTQRASGMRQKPSVDTVHVESMAAFRQQSELVFWFEFTQANGTVKCVVLHSSDDGFVVENRESIYERLVNTGIVEMEQLLQLPLKCGHTVYVFRFSIGRSQEKSN